MGLLIRTRLNFRPGELRDMAKEKANDMKDSVLADLHIINEKKRKGERTHNFVVKPTILLRHGLQFPYHHSETALSKIFVR